MRNGRRSGVQHRWAILSATLMGLSVLAQGNLALAQTGALATIHGTVSDSSGAALPGVNVTLSSPALQVGRMTKATDSDGTYRFGDLPVGTYKVAFELSGFKTFVRD